MRIIPVIDLKNGLVVRGVGGRREEYRPVESVWAAEPTPGCVARGLVEEFGLREVYVADLDAIAGGEPAWAAYGEIIDQGLGVWLDAGLCNVDRAGQLAGFEHRESPLERVIAGLESLAGPDDMRAILEAVAAAGGAERFVLSLDLRDGRPLTGGPGWQGQTPLDIAAAALDAGVRSLILLDLARVGMDEGVGTEDLCRTLRRRDSDLELVTGGGVRSLDDLKSLRRAGASAALVASALHDGRLTADGLHSFTAAGP